MRLLIVTDTFTPDVNGVARTLNQLAHGMVNLGHEVQVVATSEHAQDSPEPFVRHVVWSVPLPGYAIIRVGLATVGWFRKLFQKNATAVLYVATETPLGMAAIWAAKQCGVPVVSGFHTNFHTYLRSYHLSALKGVAEAFLRKVHNHTFRTLTPSVHTAQLLQQMGITSVQVLGRGVDSSLFMPAARDNSLRAQWGADENTPVIVHVGRLAEEKNLPVLEQAVAAFRRVQPHAKCVIVGDGPSGERLRRAHPDWIFAGMLRGAELARHYASGDVFLFPSLTETFGNVVTEALASGLLVVAYDYAAAHEHIRHGENGLLAAGEQPDALLECAQQAALHWNDSGMRSRAHATAAHISWESITAQFAQHLTDAIHHRTSAITP
jgi:glycosyltransferase involved in cell wall biosynthesis